MKTEVTTMSSEDVTGGPAYPEKNIACPNCWGAGEMNSGGTCQECRGTRCVDSSGMTVLDAFALAERSEPEHLDTKAKAAAFLGIPAESFCSVEHYPKVMAKWRFQYAQAMLAEKRRIESGS